MKKLQKQQAKEKKAQEKRKAKQQQQGSVVQGSSSEGSMVVPIQNESQLGSSITASSYSTIMVPMSVANNDITQITQEQPLPDINELLNGIPTKERLEALHFLCCNFWALNHVEFTKWWTELSNSERLNIIREVSPYTKTEFDPTHIEFTDALLPELYLNILMQPQQFIVICTTYCGGSPYIDLEEREYAAVYMVKDRFSIFKLPYMYGTMYYEGQLLQPSKKATRAEQARIQRLLPCCDANVYYLVHQRLMTLFSFCALVFGEYFTLTGEEGKDRLAFFHKYWRNNADNKKKK